MAAATINKWQLLFIAAMLTLAAILPAGAAEPRIVAVGDLHGDYSAFRAIVLDAGLVNAKGDWIGGKTVFIQTGDIPDRGPDTLKIIRAMMKLEKQAKRKGGRIVPLIGNHEAMSITGDLRYTTPEEFAAFRTAKSERLRRKYFDDHQDELRARYGGDLDETSLWAKFEAEVPLGYIEHRVAWSSRGEIGKWVLKHAAIAIVDRSVFLHGGISAAYADMPVDDINVAVREALAGAAPAAILTDESSPLWYRGNATETDEGAVEVDRALTSFNADRLVIGHTPQLEGIRTLYGGKVIVIDTGASAAIGGVRSWLEIAGGGVSVHRVSTGDAHP